MSLPKNQIVALVAHDACKDDMVNWVGCHIGVLDGLPLVATGTTGQRILEAYPGLRLTRLKSGPKGGDQQIGARIAEGKIALLVFFVDPMTAQPHDVDVKALTRLATYYNVPMACNRATADLLADSALLHTLDNKLLQMVDSAA